MKHFYFLFLIGIILSFQSCASAQNYSQSEYIDKETKEWVVINDSVPYYKILREKEFVFIPVPSYRYNYIIPNPYFRYPPRRRFVRPMPPRRHYYPRRVRNVRLRPYVHRYYRH